MLTSPAPSISSNNSASEDRFRAALDTSPNGFCMHRPIRDGNRPDGVVVDFEVPYINAAGARIVDSTPEQILGRTLLQLCPGTGDAGIFAEYVRVLETGEAWSGPETLVRYDRDGTGIQDTWFDLRFEPVHNGDGRVIAILNFAVDVTGQVRARREVERLLTESEVARADAEQARADAEAANRAKGEFLAVMSHELRTPLNAIGGYTELIEIGVHGPVTSDQRTALERIQRSQRHLLGLINGVLNYAKIDAGAVHYELTNVPLDEMLATCEALVAPQVRAKRLELRYDGCGGRLMARGDRDKVQQVVLNLLSNAVKFTEPGGRLTMKCTASGDGRVAVSVSDTGGGIPADQLERVFQPFVQVDAKLTRTKEGTGLGLAISRDLARGMGGDLTIESTTGVGSTFTLTLPEA